MSFTKTISTVAALASIFGAATAGWKLAESNSHQPPTALDQKLNELDQKLEDLSKAAPVVVPEQTPDTVPEPVVLSPEPKPATILPPPPPPAPSETTTNGTN